MRAMCSLLLSASRMIPGQGATKRVDKWSMEKWSMEKCGEDKPITGLPESRKRPHAFGTPTITQFLAAISQHRDPGRNAKTRGLRAKK
jgi:hypothetical protein